MQPVRHKPFVWLLLRIAPFSRPCYDLKHPSVVDRKMPIKPVPVSEMVLARARQVVRSLEPLKGLPSDDAEIVVRTIAQSFAEGRRQGLDMAKDWSVDD
jgi:hypothetical protein